MKLMEWTLQSPSPAWLPVNAAVSVGCGAHSSCREQQLAVRRMSNKQANGVSKGKNLNL